MKSLLHVGGNQLLGRDEISTGKVCPCRSLVVAMATFACVLVSSDFICHMCMSLGTKSALKYLSL